MQVDPPQASSPEVPLSSMPMIPTQEQVYIENNLSTTGAMGIEVDNTLGRASEDVNALLQNGGVDGWQTVMPKKNQKKAKAARRKLRNSNKYTHMESPLKERSQKRQATKNGSVIDEDEGTHRDTPSPSPTPAKPIPTMDAKGRDSTQLNRAEEGRTSTTPRANEGGQATEAWGPRGKRLFLD